MVFGTLGHACRLALLRLAIAFGRTRVATLMFAKDLSPATYPESGNRSGFHGASHHANAKANMDNFALINKYHVSMLAYFIDHKGKDCIFIPETGVLIDLEAEPQRLQDFLDGRGFATWESDDLYGLPGDLEIVEKWWIDAAVELYLDCKILAIRDNRSPSVDVRDEELLRSRAGAHGRELVPKTRPPKRQKSSRDRR